MSRAKTDLRNRPLHIRHNEIDNLWDHHNEIISTKIVYGKAIDQASRPGSHVKRGIMIEKGIHLLKNLNCSRKFTVNRCSFYALYSSNY